MDIAVIGGGLAGLSFAASIFKERGLLLLIYMTIHHSAKSLTMTGADKL